VKKPVRCQKYCGVAGILGYVCGSLPVLSGLIAKWILPHPMNDNCGMMLRAEQNFC
jgi:hypothetical protein